MKTKAILTWLALGVTSLGEMIDYPTPASVSIGDGYDLLLKTWKSSPFANPKTVEAANTADSTTLLTKVETSQEVKTALDINSDNEFGMVVSGSLSAKFFKEVELHRYAMNFVVSSRCLLTGKRLDGSPVLNEQAKQLLADGDFIGFRNLYGDYYVKTIVPGGVFFGLIQVNNESAVETEKQKVQANAQGFNWSSRNNFLNSSFVKTSGNSLKLQRKISGIIAQEPGNAEQMISFAESFAEKVKQSGGSPLKVEVRPYSELPEYRAAVNPVPLERRQTLQRLSDHYIDYRLLLDDLNFALTESNSGKFDFDAVTRADIEQSRERVRDVIRKIEAGSEQVFKGEMEAASGILPRHEFAGQLKLPRDLIVLQNRTMEVFPLLFVRPPAGRRWDRDMKGNSPTIDINAQLIREDKSLSARATVTMVEGRADWTQFSHTKTEKWLDLTGTGFRILRASPETGGLRSQGGRNEHHFRLHGNGQGLVKSANCQTDADDDEDGKIGAKPINFNDVRVTLERDSR